MSQLGQWPHGYILVGLYIFPVIIIDICNIGGKESNVSLDFWSGLIAFPEYIGHRVM